ncbi:MAG: rod shape-determining protein RodA [bacterium]|nr:rod shape-determining protein RodA [bacterium]
MTDLLLALPRRVFSRRHVRPHELDWHILLIAMGLLAIGMTFVSAMDGSVANETSDSVNFAGHRQKVLVTLPLILVGMFIRPTFLKRNAHWLYVGTLLLVALVPFIGEERNNAKRWIQLQFFDLQPSELAKLGLILMLAKLLHSNPLEDTGDWLKPLAAALLPMGMVAMQPDLGTALTIVPVSIGMLYLAGGSARVIACLALVGGLLAWGTVEGGFVREYQLKRIDTWQQSFDQEGLVGLKDGSGFHIYHARVAAGNGGFYGRGLGEGVANETGFLPERDSDSIFAVIAEEAGFLGTSCLLLLYAAMVLLLMGSASGLRDRFSRLVVGGVALYFGAHLFINVWVNVGLLPMTGLTLPFFSTGGSSLLVTFLALGIALGLASHHEASLDRDAFRAY